MLSDADQSFRQIPVANASPSMNRSSQPSASLVVICCGIACTVNVPGSQARQSAEYGMLMWSIEHREDNMIRPATHDH
jgi:hypothetical protein